MIGPWQIGIIAIVLLILFGGARLATAGKGLGEGIRNFRRALRDKNDDSDE
jgi:sec-independent protein translocase protein TatA